MSSTNKLICLVDELDITLTVYYAKEDGDMDEKTFTVSWNRVTNTLRSPENFPKYKGSRLENLAEWITKNFSRQLVDPTQCTLTLEPKLHPYDLVKESEVRPFFADEGNTNPDLSYRLNRLACITLNSIFAQREKRSKVISELRTSLKETFYRADDTIDRVLVMISEYGTPLKDSTEESLRLRNLRQDVIMDHLDSYMKDAKFIREEFGKAFMISEKSSNKVKANISSAEYSLKSMELLHNMCLQQISYRNHKHVGPGDIFFRESDIVNIKSLAGIIKYDFDRLYQAGTDYPMTH